MTTLRCADAFSLVDWKSFADKQLNRYGEQVTISTGNQSVPVCEELAGGRIAAEVFRVGNRVHRTPPPLSQQPAGFQAELLTALPELGVTFAPRYYGQDESGLDVLSYLPGRTHMPRAELSIPAIGLFAGMLRQLHVSTAGHRLAGNAPCIVHGDPGPWNVAFDERNLPSSLFDWDTACPGSPLHDFAYLAWTWCIFGAPDAPLAEEQARLRAARDAYDTALPASILCDAIIERAQQASDWADARLADASLPEAAHEHARVSDVWNRQIVARVRAQADAYRTALDPAWRGNNWFTPVDRTSP